MGRAESTGPYQGTTVTMEFPVPVLMDQPTTWLKAPPAATDGMLIGNTVLIVDDDEQTLTAVQNVLEHHGAAVLRAGSTAQALALLERHQPTVIVADLSMPDRDGIELIKSIRQLDSPASAVPAAVLSAHVQGDQAAIANAAGFQMYIEKPVRPDVFVRHIASLAGMH